MSNKPELDQFLSILKTNYIPLSNKTKDKIILPFLYEINNFKSHVTDYSLFAGASHSYCLTIDGYSLQVDKNKAIDIAHPHSFSHAIFPTFTIDLASMSKEFRNAFGFHCSTNLNQLATSQNFSQSLPMATFDCLVYPQDLASNAKELEKLFEQSSDELVKTNRTFKHDFETLFPTKKSDLYKENGNIKASCNQVAEEYLYKGKRYIRANCDQTSFEKLSDGKKVMRGETRWFKVEPIPFLVKKDINGFFNFMSKVGLMAGFEAVSQNKYGWQNSQVRAFLNDYDLHAEISKGNGDPNKIAEQNYNFSNNEGLFPCEGFLNSVFLTEKDRNQALEQINALSQNSKSIAVNPKRQQLNVTIDDTPMTIEEQLKFYVDTGKSFMLHGPSGIGKTRRIQELDPDCVTIQLRDGILPEEIIGKTAFEDKSAIRIEPSWYTRICELCEKEPDRNHILFIDELANVRANEQSMVFHIVLDHSIDGNNGKLPKNCVVVAAGNSVDESESANPLTEPLFRRFYAHIDLPLDLNSWLEWGSELREDGRTKIHPLVASFVATYSDKVFYTKYDKDDPPKYAIDPRGWEQVSDIIYDNNNTLREKLLADKIGPKNAKDLIDHAIKAEENTLEKIKARLYEPITDSHLKYYTMCYLRHVGKDDLDIIRNFINTYLGEGYCEDFDRLWANGDSEKEKIIKELADRKPVSIDWDKYANISNQPEKIKPKIMQMFKDYSGRVEEKYLVRINKWLQDNKIEKEDRLNDFTSALNYISKNNISDEDALSLITHLEQGWIYEIALMAIAVRQANDTFEL